MVNKITFILLFFRNVTFSKHVQTNKNKIFFKYNEHPNNWKELHMNVYEMSKEM